MAIKSSQITPSVHRPEKYSAVSVRRTCSIDRPAPDSHSRLASLSCHRQRSKVTSGKTNTNRRSDNLFP
ncbi:unnamed protein product [Lota lota]